MLVSIGKIVKEEMNLLKDQMPFEPDENLYYTTLFADIAGTTYLVDNYDAAFSGFVLLAYLKTVSYSVKQYSGRIISFEGDGVMAIFDGKSGTKNAIECAKTIDHVVEHYCNSMIKEHFPMQAYLIRHKIGIDYSELRSIRTGIWDRSDTLWIGRGANYAANMTRIPNPNFNIVISEEAIININSHEPSSDIFSEIDFNEFSCKLYALTVGGKL